MMPYGTAAEAEAALGRSLTWAEAWWFWYSARMPDFWLMWHIALVYFVMYAIVSLPLLLLQQLAPAFALKYKVPVDARQQEPGQTTRLAWSWVHPCFSLMDLVLVITRPYPLLHTCAC
ncbi:uncharacterized protein C2845_PM06G29500 [Panicum miliaceum]|uniref:Uncharacterized protein n=1 Tax=Panicum miliaceum TaxID=4540 RepID=A0A3L6R8E3_PANMI|nr:uncharacterized protein C2845_PM06G29500 [Panicum miliaceum]